MLTPYLSSFFPGSFLGVTEPVATSSELEDTQSSGEHMYSNDSDDDEQFKDMMQNFGAYGIFDE